MNKFTHKFITMTSLTGVFLLIGSMFFATPYAKAETNLIPNASVETGAGAYPNFWSREKVGNNISVFQYATNGQEGVKSMSINVTKYTSGHSGWFFNPLNISPNVTYVYSEYYKATMPTEIYLRVINTSGATSDILLGKVDFSGGWKQVSLEFTTPGDAKTVTIVHKAKAVLRFWRNPARR